MHHGISRFRKMAVAAAATVATTAGLLPLAATGAGATASFDLTRLAGADRYGTAAAISTASFPTATDVVLATGENFPDALAGNYLAGTRSAPILLTTRTSVPAATQAEISRLNPQRVWVLGGTDAIGAGGVPTTSATVNRVAGATRYETAVAADSTGTVGTIGGKPTAIIATGDKFADALSAGPGAYAGNFPLYLTPGAPATALHPATKSALTARGITNVILMGGVNAVSAAVATELQGMGITVTRVEGADRTETARNFAIWLKTNLGFSASLMDVARGDLFPDALAGGPHSGKEKAPILLTWTPQEASPGNNPALGALKFASDNASTLTGGHIFGGINAVSSAAETAIETAGKTGAGNVTATSRPELVSATIVGTTTAGQVDATHLIGTTVAYTFDEAVVNAVGALFHVYDATGADVNAGAGVATIQTDNRIVNVRFPGIATTAQAATLTTATNDLGAVTDASGQNAPEGDAGIGAGGQSTLTAGTTAAPDLVSVGGFRGPLAGNGSAVDFVFDQAAFVQTAAGTEFNLVATDGTVTACQGPTTTSSNNTNPSGQNVAGGNASTTITVICPALGPGSFLGQQASAANTARGYVTAAAVGTTPPAGTVNGVTGAACGAANADPSPVTNRCNPLQASNTPDNPTATPDLVSASFTMAASAASCDTVTYTFDEGVQPATVNTANFFVYSNAGVEAPGNTCGVAPQPFQVAGAQVVIFYPFGTLASAVGANVRPGGVTAVAGTNQPNRADEVGVTNTTASTTTPDRTGAPDLVSVALTSTTVGFATSWAAVYTFDEALGAATTPPGVAPQLFLHLADGSRMVCANPGAVTIGTSLNGLTTSQVRCNAYTFVDGVPDESGTNTGAATQTQVGSAVLGTVDRTGAAGTLQDAAGNFTPEGGERTSGGLA